MSGGITWFKYRSLHAYNHHTTVTGGNMDFKNFGYLQRFFFSFLEIEGVEIWSWCEGKKLFRRG